MSVLHVQQIKNKFHEYFDGLTEVADYLGRPPEQIESVFLTRSLAAFAIAHLTGATFPNAAASVTDEPSDGGIDAVYWDDLEKTLYLVQAKWSHDGTGTIDEAGMLKFLNGAQRLISANYDAFLIPKNDGAFVQTKVYSRRSEVQNALKSANAKVALVTAYTGTQALANEPRNALEAFLQKHNSPSELLKAYVLRLGDIHGALDSHGQGIIKATIDLIQWGMNAAPFKSFYGQVPATTIAKLYDEIGNKLFAPNLRIFLGGTPVNDDIVQTALNEPDRFWYFNNGITALCTKVEKLPYGGGQSELGVFECTGFHVVNGAQTVGSLHRAYKANAEAIKNVKVAIRLISLEGSPPEVGDLITRRTNTQNGIGKKDFAALDDEQLRLQRELRLEGVSYAVKSGELIDDRSKGFDFAEAMTALACDHGDLMMTVTAKREVSRLWEDISKPPYSLLVHAGIHGLLLWKLVQIQRLVEEELGLVEQALQGRNAQIVVHGNRLIERTVLKRLKSKYKTDFAKDMGIDAGEIRALARDIGESLVEQVQDPKNGLTEAYPGNIFKNKERCADLEQKLQSSKWAPTPTESPA